MRFKQTKLDRRLFTWNYFNLKVLLQYENPQNIDIWKTIQMIQWIQTTKCGIEIPLTLALNYGILFQMNIKLSHRLRTLRQNKNSSPRDLSLKVIKNIFIK